MNKKKITVLVTGSAGFIGFHTCLALLQHGVTVVGVDCFSNYYDVNLKVEREKILLSHTNYHSEHGNIYENSFLHLIFEKWQPEKVIHLAAQAGVRYSIEDPRTYLNNNIVGTFELLEAARAFPPDHVLMASTSSAYGANEELPLNENAKCDHQMSFYAATKKSTENMAHSYSHIFNIPVTMLRFFSVYGPWGRPDMALYLFTEAIQNNRPINVFNHGKMKRDFTYVDDLVGAILALMERKPDLNSQCVYPNDSLSKVAPYRVVNIGNSKTIELMDYISAIERATGKKAIKNLMPMQAGDIAETLADTTLLTELTGFKCSTSVEEGITKFVNWYKEYHNIKCDKEN